MACHFQVACLATEAKRAWASIGNGKWLAIMICDGCYKMVEYSSTVITKEPTTEQWIKQLYDDMVGEN